ncbi:MAG: hypothetical protein QNI84_02710 [Henriciella sp.]|nr:hypothetical protein [Henriciella sp.]
MDLTAGLAERLALQVLSRDEAQLAPLTLTQAAARRMRQGLRALEAFLRRVILCLALQIEPNLPRTDRFARIKTRKDQPDIWVQPNALTGFCVFRGERDFDPWAEIAPAMDSGWRQPAPPAYAAPLLARLTALKTLAQDPMARARRLAWHIARYRPGPMFAPDAFRSLVPRRYGTELSAVYDGMRYTILTASEARPPPLGPRPKPGPRIRRL